MGKLRVNDVELFYRSEGDGAETIFFSHGYLMFDGQIEAFKGQFRCVSFDHRGHGQSEVTADEDKLDNLVTDAIALIEGHSAAVEEKTAVSDAMRDFYKSSRIL